MVCKTGHLIKMLRLVKIKKKLKYIKTCTWKRIQNNCLITN